MKKQNNEKFNILISTEGTVFGKYSLDKEFNTIQINVNSEDKYESLFDNNKLEKDFKIQLSSLEIYYSDDVYNGDEEATKRYELEKQAILNMKKSIGDLRTYFENSDTIQFVGECDKIGKFLVNNALYLKDKKIEIVSNVSLLKPLDIIALINVTQYYNADNIFVKLSNLPGKDNKKINLNELMRVFEIFYDILKDVKEHELSPLEQLIYVYDLLKERRYNNLNKKCLNIKSNSCDEEVLNFDYNYIFHVIASHLGLDSYMVNMKSKKNKQEKFRSLVHIQDEKYDIDGMYYFDISGEKISHKDSKNKYLNSYDYFALTKDEMDATDSNELNEDYIYKETDVFGGDFYKSFDFNLFRAISYAIIDCMNKSDEEIYQILKPYQSHINRLSQMFDGYDFLERDPNIFKKVYKDLDLSDKKGLITQFGNYFMKFKSYMDRQKKFDAIFAVRKEEYLNNPSKYPFSKRDLYEVLYSIYFNDVGLVEKRNLLSKNPLNEMTLENIVKQIRDVDTSSVEEEIEETKKLTKK